MTNPLAPEYAELADEHFSAQELARLFSPDEIKLLKGFEGADAWLNKKFLPAKANDDDATYLVNTGPVATLTYIPEAPDRLSWETRMLNLHSETAGDPDVLLQLALDIKAFRSKFEELGYKVKNLSADPDVIALYRRQYYADSKGSFVRYGADKKIQPHEVPQEVERVLLAFQDSAASLLNAKTSES